MLAVVDDPIAIASSKFALAYDPTAMLSPLLDIALPPMAIHALPSAIALYPVLMASAAELRAPGPKLIELLPDALAFWPIAIEEGPEAVLDPMAIVEAAIAFATPTATAELPDAVA